MTERQPGELLFHAFRALGMGADVRDVEHVVRALRAHGDERVGELLTAAGEDRGAFEQVTAIADVAGAGGLVALDVVTEYCNPGCHASRGRPHPPRDPEAAA